MGNALPNSIPESLIARILKSEQRGTHKSWARAIKDIRYEHDFKSLSIEGTLPKDLNGTLYLNGPGFFSHFGKPYRYWPDGDGMITAISLRDGQASGAIKLIQNDGLVLEREADKPLFGSVGTSPPSFASKVLRKYKNPANTNVFHWGNRMFALYEGGLPIEFDPFSLKTIGECDLGVVANRFSAHPKSCPTRNTQFNFGLEYGMKSSLKVYEFSVTGGAKVMTSIPLDNATICHDFVVTRNHIVFFINPVKVKVGKLLMGRGSIIDNLKWDGKLGTEVIIVPIDNPKNVKRFRTDPFFQWHFANAYEEDDDRIIVDFVKYSRFNMVGKINPKTQKWASDKGIRGYLNRACIDHKRKQVTITQLWSEKCELPAIWPGLEGEKHQRLYLGTFSDEVMKKEGAVDQLSVVDPRRGLIDQVTLGKNITFTEPQIVNTSSVAHENAGYLLSLAYDAEHDRSFLAVFDAMRLSEGPVARIHFDQPIPHIFHGKWISMNLL